MDGPHGSADEAAEARAYFARELRRLRKAAGLTQPALARRMHYTREYVTLTESGRTLPSEEFARRAATALNAPELLELHQQAAAKHAKRKEKALAPTISSSELPAQTLAGLVQTTSAHGNVVIFAGLGEGEILKLRAVLTDDSALYEKAHTAGEQEAMDRATFLRLTGGVTAGAFAELAETLDVSRGELGRVLGTVRIGKRRLERLERAAERYARIYAVSTPLQVGPGIRDHYQAVSIALGQTQHDDHRVRLLRVAGRFAGLMSWLCFDTNQQGAALDYLDEGIEAAEQAEDRPLAGYLTASRNRVASAEGDHQELRDAGETALAITGEGNDVSGRMLAWCYGLVARGRAGMGDLKGMEEALSRAERVLDENGRATHGPELEFFDVTRFKALVGECYVFAHRPQFARAHLDEALGLLTPAQLKLRAMVELDLARAEIQAGEVSDGRDRALQALTPISMQLLRPWVS